VTWYDAAAYCNWLSEQEGIPKEQWCYVWNEQGQYGPGMKMVGNFFNRSGYRLPTALEWEYACRAGSVTRWSLGEAEDLLTKYAWFVSNAWSRLHPVGELRPNDLGLFDMHGNAWEWCQFHQGPKNVDPGSSPDFEVTDTARGIARGGAFGHGPLTAHSVSEIEVIPTERGGDLGFRPVRTVR
jgi:formylglycine-generating enzyme required for sulfatase activity